MAAIEGVTKLMFTLKGRRFYAIIMIQEETGCT